jgi:PAS domain-containing protein
VSCDAEGVFMVSNRAERALFGLAAGLEGRSPERLATLIDVFDADGNQLAVEDYPLMRTLRGDGGTPVDVAVGPAGGPHREVLVRGSQITSPAGAVLGTVAALTDVTAERTASRALAEERGKLAVAEKAAQRANAFLNAVLSASPDFTFVTDLATNAVIHSSSDKDVLCITGKQLEGLGPEAAATLIHPDDQLRLRAVSTAAADLDDGQVLQLRYRGCRLSSVLREDDTVARVGGEEFVIVVEPWSRNSLVRQADLPDPGPEPHRALSVRVAERVAEALRRPIAVNGIDHVVTASIGITYATRGRDSRTGRVTADEVLQDADAAMYRAKELGKDRFEVFEHGPRPDPVRIRRVDVSLAPVQSRAD